MHIHTQILYFQLYLEKAIQNISYIVVCKMIYCPNIFLWILLIIANYKKFKAQAWIV